LRKDHLRQALRESFSHDGVFESLDALEYAIIVLCPVGYVWALEPAAAATVESIRGSFAQPTPQGVPLNGDAIAASEAERGKHPGTALRVAVNRSDGKSPEMKARALIL